MPKTVECTVTSWGSLPVMCGIKELQAILGIGYNEARDILNRPDASVVDYGVTKKIEKYALKRWVQKGIRKGDTNEN